MRSRLLKLTVVVLALLMVVGGAALTVLLRTQPAQAMVFAVNSPLDTPAPFPGFPGELRWAMNMANITGGPDQIVFAIGGGGPFTITLNPANGPLPPITDPVMIDGTTQPGYAGTPIIELDGSAVGLADGLNIQNLGSGSLIRGLAINRFALNGIYMNNAFGNVIIANHIGTDMAGLAPMPNSQAGIYIVNGSAGNQIGSSNPADRNVISANGWNGIYLDNSPNNMMFGNYIGTDATGANPLGNQWNGVQCVNNANGNLIGGGNPGEGNVISGNVSSGVNLGGVTVGTVIQGNYIGTDASGTVALPNGVDGVTVTNNSAGNTIGGNTAAQGNLISGNGVNGVSLTGGATGNTVSANYIGTDIGGTTALPNANDGVYINGADGNTVGGDSTAGWGNLISGNGWNGVFITNTTTGNMVLGNYIGTDVSGTSAVPNAYCGVTTITAANDAIGGNSTGYGNLISGNSSDGIALRSGSNAVTIKGNLIGTDAAGTAAIPNTASGIYIWGSNGNTVGGNTAGDRNILSGNILDGIALNGSSGNNIYGNYIGTTADGLLGLGNLLHGVYLFAGSNVNTIGGNFAGAGNVISGNASQGVLITNSSGNVVSGNYVGTDAAGSSAVPNACGIRLAPANGNTIGGATAAERNLVSGNTGDGMAVWGSSNNLYGNYVGTDAPGATPLPNGGRGIALYNGASLNNIGGGNPGEGNLISGNTTDGIDLTQSTSNTIRGNYIGTDAAGIATVANGGRGIYIQTSSSNNTVGGSNPGEGNVISGNGGHGVLIDNSTGNQVLGNLIGVDATGAAAMGNGLEGVAMYNGANGNTVGGPAAGDRNVISGNGTSGVIAGGSTGSVIQGNYVGTDATGTAGFGNAGHGVWLGSGANGSTLRANLIGCNAASGVLIESNGNTLEANLIGTDAAGSAAAGWGNGENGVAIGSGGTGNTVGGNAAGEGNLISGNSYCGVYIGSADSNTVSGNLIGTDAAGTSALANGFDGVGLAAADSNTIGGATAFERNLISGNAGNGVSAYNSYSNVIRGNYIGTDAAGTSALGNGGDGVNTRFDSPSTSNNTIGGAAAGQGNLISGNGGDGIECHYSISTGIFGNYIGTDVTGTAALGNAWTGVNFSDFCDNSQVGGDSTAGQGNVISGNAGYGIYAYNTYYSSVYGNYVGTDVTGTAALGNGLDGIYLASCRFDYIGGSGAGERNLISGNGSSGITAAFCSNDQISNNYIGTNAAGTAALGNILQGIYLTNSSGNTIGGDSTAGEGNLISGNGDNGVRLDYSEGNGIYGNRIGTDAAGTTALGNGNDGVCAYTNSNSNLIGGDSGAGLGNLISGNGACGIFVNDASIGNSVQGSYIGTDAAGTAALGNTYHGVHIVNNSNGNTVGGDSTAGLGNLISGNTLSGICLEDSDLNSAYGNLIGTDVAGTAPLANLQRGLFLTTGADGNTIGGPGSGEGNVITGNTFWSGLLIFDNSDGNTVQGNWIGTDTSGSVSLGNSWGVRISSNCDSNLIGGPNAGEGNVLFYNSLGGVLIGSTSTSNAVENNDIQHNAGAGVRVDGATSVENRISINSIYDNVGLGIDLVDGANYDYPAPVFSSNEQPIASGILTVTGTAPLGARVEFFYVGASQDPSGYGEGYTYLDYTDADPVTGEFFLNIGGTGLVDGDYISATATSPAGDPLGEGNTSEFALNARVTDGWAVTAWVNGGNGTVDPDFQAILDGDPAEIDIIPSTGYHLFFITDNSLPMPLADPYAIPAVTTDHDVMVIYDIDRYDVNAYVTGGHGSVSPAGQSVPYGDPASIDLTPDPGYHIETITDNDVAQALANPYVIDPVTEVHNVVVTFAADFYDVNATVFFGGGSVNPAYQSVAYFGTASIDLIPDTGYHASYILDNGVPATVADPYVISNVTEDHDVVVFFEIDTYTIDASADPVGSGSVGGAGDYQYGSTCTLTATPAAGWSFFDWTEGGSEVSTDAAYSFTVTGPRTLVANFTYPWVNAIAPRFIASPGPVSVTLNGSGFRDGAAVTLSRAGSTDIAATNVLVVSDTQITCDFDLSGTATGAWNLSFTNPDGGWNSLHNAFFVGTMSGTGWGFNGNGQCSVPDENDLAALTGGNEYSMALLEDGSLIAWGRNIEGQCNVPAGYDFIQVSAGYRHGLALHSDGSIAAWGDNGSGQCNAPAGTGFVAVSAGNNHSLALRSDGSLASWGSNSAGQVTDTPAGNDFVAISAGHNHSLALRSDGSLAAWGWNAYGQCDVPAGNDFVAVEGGWGHSLALRSDGSLISWGNDDNRQVTDTPAGNDFVQIEAGSVHSLALRSDGSIAAWGGDSFGQVSNTPAGNDFTAISADFFHSLALCRPFEVTASAGGGGGGAVDPAFQLAGFGRDASIDLIPDPNYHIAAVTDNGVPQIWTDPYVIYNVREAHDVVVDFAIDTYTITASVGTGFGTVDGGGVYDYGSTCYLDANPDTGYHFVNWTEGGTEVSTDELYSFTVTGDRDLVGNFAVDTFPVNAAVFYTGHGAVDPATQTIDYGDPATIDLYPDPGYQVSYILDNSVPVAGPYGDSYTIPSVTGAHEVIVFFGTIPAELNSVMPKYAAVPGPVGFDLGGKGFQPGARVLFTRAGSTEMAATAVTVNDHTWITCSADFSAAATGAWNVKVINPDGGSAYLANAFFAGEMSGTAWGYDGSGQCGVPDVNDYVAIAAGSLHSVALHSDGSLAAWGDNSLDQLNVPTGNDYVAITAGMYHSLALKEDGSLAAWGNNYSGQCNVPAGNDYVAVSAGWEFSLALKADGSLVAWGGNDYGECDVPAGNDFTAIAAGSWHNLALKADGSLAAWGRNDFGQGSVLAGNDYAAVCAGALHNLVLKTDGSLAAWGWNAYGQCDVPAGNDFVAVNAGQSHSVALRSDGSLAAWGDNGSGQCSVPPGDDFTAVEGGGFHSMALCRPYDVDAWVTGSGGSVDPTYQRVGFGRTAQINLYPDAHWHVATITDNGVPQMPSDIYYIYNVNQNHDVETTFALDTYTITASVGTGSGSVDGGGVYDWGSTCYLLATPDTGWHFVNWTEGGTEVSTDELYSFTVDANRDLVANFEIDTFTVNATVYYTDHGDATPATQTIDYGSPASITLTPETGYHTAWITDNGVPVPGPYGATYDIASVTADHTVIVTFAINTYTIDASVTGGHGTVDPADQTCDWGTKAEIDLIPEEGYHIATITDNGTPVPVADPYVINPVTEDHAVEVTFEINTYEVTASVSGGHGTAAPATQTVDWGTPASITLTPALHYHIATVTDNGVAKAPASPYVIPDVREAHTVVATFAIDTYTWYLAEGCTAGGTETWILAENANDYPVTINVSFATAEGLFAPSALQGYVIAANTRVTFNAGSYIETYQLSTIIAAQGGNVICERAMYGNSRTWGSDSIGTQDPADTWYLAEGSTGPGFETWILVMNPGDAEVNVDLNLMTSAGPQAGPQNVAIPAKSRKSFNLGLYVTDYDVSTLVAASGEVVAERAMYGNSRTWAHDSIGTPVPADTWYLAEGSTGEGFETWVLVQNPGAAPVTVDLTLMTGAGRQNPPALQDVSIPAHSRKSFNLGLYVTDFDVSTLVESTGGEVIAERSMYDTGRNWGTCSIGATAPATTWLLAEGSTGPGFETWVLVQNPGTSSVTVDLSFLTSTGPVAGPQDVVIPGGSRKSFNLGDYVTDYNVSTEVVSTGGVVCERAMYGAGRVWAHDSVGYAP